MATYCSTCDSKDAEIARLRWNASLDMYNQAGGLAAIAALPTGTYAVVFCDIDRLKAINAATGNHLQTNRYLRDGLRVRHGEIAMQLFGDEFVFVLQCDDVSAFVRRLQRQLAAQPLTADEQDVLIRAGAAPQLSATFAWRTRVEAPAITSTIEQLSIEVLRQKARRSC